MARHLASFAHSRPGVTMELLLTVMTPLHAGSDNAGWHDACPDYYATAIGGNIPDSPDWYDAECAPDGKDLMACLHRPHSAQVSTQTPTIRHLVDYGGAVSSSGTIPSTGARSRITPTWETASSIRHTEPMSTLARTPPLSFVGRPSRLLPPPRVPDRPHIGSIDRLGRGNRLFT